MSGYRVADIVDARRRWAHMSHKIMCRLTTNWSLSLEIE